MGYATLLYGLVVFVNFQAEFKSSFFSHVYGFPAGSRERRLGKYESVSAWK